jgi:TPR repeat protein
MLYEEGQGVAQDVMQAVRFYRGACEAEDGEACYRLGVMYRDGIGVTRQTYQAVALFRRACRLGQTAACERRT